MDDCSIPTLETERLWLRPFRRSDLDAFAEMHADAEVTRGFGREPYPTPLSAWRFLALLVGHWQLEGCGMWAVEEKATGTFLGRIGFSCPAQWPGLELAGALARRFWGRGYATEGSRAALTYAFESPEPPGRVISLVRPENVRSRRLVERLGETHSGQVEIEGTLFDVFAIHRDTYLRTCLRSA